MWYIQRYKRKYCANLSCPQTPSFSAWRRPVSQFLCVFPERVCAQTGSVVNMVAGSPPAHFPNPFFSFPFLCYPVVVFISPQIVAQ